MLGADLHFRAAVSREVLVLEELPGPVANGEITWDDSWQLQDDPDSTLYAKVQAPTRALNRAVRSVTTGRSPVPMERPSNERIATISLAVPQRKASSAV
jgi:hypothetical protein